MFAFCASTAAHAGYYVPFNSGGTWTGTHPYWNGFGNYTLSNDGYWGTSQSNSVSGNSGSVIINASGTITTTFTWVADGPQDHPPKYVVVRERSAASWGTQDSSNTNTSGSKAHGLTSDIVAVVSSAQKQVAAVGYRIKVDPGASFQITASPSASASCAVKYGYTLMIASVGISYRAEAEPVEVILTGGIGPSWNKKYLIGQKVTAQLRVPFGMTASNHNWTAVGGEPFKTYTADASNAIRIGLGSETNSTFGFHFKEPVSNNGAVVKCTNVMLTPVEGGGTINASPQRECSVDKPSSSLSAISGVVVGSPSNNPSMIKFGGANYQDSSNQAHVAGILWYGEVETPAEYGSAGGWNFTQVVTPHRVMTSPGVTHNFSHNGNLVLDTTFGYDPVAPDMYAAGGQEEVSGDSPSQGFYSPLTYVEVLDSFKTYTLYLPPNSDSCFVPLKNLKWFWEGKASPNGSGVWQIYNTAGSWSFLEDFPDHPLWGGNVATGNFIPPLP